jgi:two-component system, cell cycle sensor histidine kinase and response regulator CckA
MNRAVQEQPCSSAADQNLGGSFDELAAALAAVGMGLWELSAAQGSLRLSARAAQLFNLEGRGAAEISLETVLSLIPPSARDDLRQDLDELVRHGSPIERDLPLATPGDRVRWIQLRGHRLGSTVAPSVLCRGTIHDTTRLREHDATASDRAERYRLLVEKTHELVAEIALDGRFCYVNPCHEAVLGHGPSELLGTTAFDLIHPEDLPRILEHFQGDHASDVYRFRHKDGSWRWLESTGSRFRTSGGEERGVVISRDVTERRKAEQDKSRLESHLRHAQKMETIGTLAGGIAHDFNNILGVIIAYTELSRLDLPETHPVQTGLGQVMQASHRAKDLVQQILAFSRQQQMERRPIRLDEPLNDALELFRSSQKRPIDLSLRLDPDTPPVLADSGQIRQVVLNLCSNAFLALPADRGSIEILLDRVDGKTDPRGRLGPLDYARIRVRDTGCGMEPGTVKRVFDPFFTTRQEGEGSGLGLSVVHGVVKSHGGLVQVDSTPGKGSTFEVFLPRFSGAGTV